MVVSFVHEIRVSVLGGSEAIPKLLILVLLAHDSLGARPWALCVLMVACTVEALWHGVAPALLRCFLLHALLVGAVRVAGFFLTLA